MWHAPQAFIEWAAADLDKPLIAYNQALAVPTPFNAVYYAGHAVSPKIRALVDFLAEEWGRDAVFENRPQAV